MTTIFDPADSECLRKAEHWQRNAGCVDFLDQWAAACSWGKSFKWTVRVEGLTLVKVPVPPAIKHFLRKKHVHPVYLQGLSLSYVT